MFSVHAKDDNFDPVVKESIMQKTCIKCRKKAVVAIRMHDTFCQDCFQVYVVHKFRSSIGKSKLIRDGEHILVAFSGGASSAALLHLIQEGRSERAHRKLRFTAAVIHVDETGILNLPIEEREKKLEQVKHFLHQRQLPFYLTSLEQSLTLKSCDVTGNDSTLPLCWDIREGTGAAEFEQRIQQTPELCHLLSSFSSVSAREEYVHLARKNILSAVAQQKGFNKILVGDCLTRLSVRILTDIAQGRGSQVSLDTNIGDKRYGALMFIRPLRNLCSKEVVMYNKLNEIDSIFIPNLTTKSSASSSIERLTENFIIGLQANFPSTVSNIVRTSEKLGLPDLKVSEYGCTFCKSPLDTSAEETSVHNTVNNLQRMSLSFSIDSKCAHENFSVSEPLCHFSNNDHQAKKDNIMQTEPLETLCYGCQLLMKGMMDLTLLPPSFVQRPEIKDQVLI